jgi:hypothetical protein
MRAEQNFRFILAQIGKKSVHIWQWTGFSWSKMEQDVDTIQ